MYLSNVIDEGKISDIVGYLTDLNNDLKDDKYKIWRRLLDNQTKEKV